MESRVIIETSAVIHESFMYKGVCVQRMVKDMVWYAVYGNKIINWSRDRERIKGWIDTNIISI